MDKLEKLYNVILSSNNILESELDINAMDALIETMDNLYYGEVHIEDNQPEEHIVKKLRDLYNEINLKDYDAETARKAIQLHLIHISKKLNIQANHQFTPDSIGFFISYLLEIINPEFHDNVKILDPVVGTGNLLGVILNYFKRYQIQGIGVDNDDSIISIAGASFNIQGSDVELIHQDFLSELNLSNIDLVIGDLPIGYYPIKEISNQYQTGLFDKQSVAHNLIIEKILQTLKPDGVSILIVASDIFENESGKKLLKYLSEKAFLQAMFNLPQSIFSSDGIQKAIIVLQKQGFKSSQAEPILLENIASLKDKNYLQKLLLDFKKWSNMNMKG